MHVSYVSNHNYLLILLSIDHYHLLTIIIIYDFLLLSIDHYHLLSMISYYYPLIIIIY